LKCLGACSFEGQVIDRQYQWVVTLEPSIALSYSRQKNLAISSQICISRHVQTYLSKAITVEINNPPIVSKKIVDRFRVGVLLRAILLRRHYVNEVPRGLGIDQLWWKGIDRRAWSQFRKVDALTI
jgi:hypothetical protein